MATEAENEERGKTERKEEDVWGGDEEEVSRGARVSRFIQRGLMRVNI